MRFLDLFVISTECEVDESEKDIRRFTVDNIYGWLGWMRLFFSSLFILTLKVVARIFQKHVFLNSMKIVKFLHEDNDE